VTEVSQHVLEQHADHQLILDHKDALACARIFLRCHRESRACADSIRVLPQSALLQTNILPLKVRIEPRKGVNVEGARLVPTSGIAVQAAAAE
jgi:hypothetical protein